MKIVIGQINQTKNKISIEIHHNKDIYSYTIDKADGFLLCIDKFLKKHKIRVESLEKAGLVFVGTGILTERIIRSIMAGLNFHSAGDPSKGDMLKFRPKF
jgi:hypothetical protein